MMKTKIKKYLALKNIETGEFGICYGTEDEFTLPKFKILKVVNESVFNKFYSYVGKIPAYEYLKEILEQNNTMELSSAQQQLIKEIREAYIFLRENNMSIPSDTLQFMLDASIEKAKQDYKIVIYKPKAIINLPLALEPTKTISVDKYCDDIIITINDQAYYGTTYSSKTIPLLNDAEFFKINTKIFKPI